MIGTDGRVDRCAYATKPAGGVGLGKLPIPQVADDPARQSALCGAHLGKGGAVHPKHVLDALRHLELARADALPPLLRLERGEILSTERLPVAIQVVRKSLGAVELALQLLHVGEVLLLGPWRKATPIDTPKPAENIEQLMVAELKRRRGEEQHALERALQRTIYDAHLLGMFLVDEQRGESRVGVLEVMRFVQDQEGRLEPGAAQRLGPDLAQLRIDGLAEVAETFVDVGGGAGG